MSTQLPTTNLFSGGLTRLVAADPDKDAPTLRAWSRDDEFLRLFGSDPVRPWTEAGIKKELNDYIGEEEPSHKSFQFLIRALEGDKLIGMCELTVDYWPHREAWVAIGLGDRAYWGKGYGTDAMRVLLRYAFQELSLHRVSLGVFGYNERAQKSYLKVGFQVEGRMRERLRRAGQWHDMVVMGVLRSEWKDSM
jgi:RimJ/RimL family protein N-acetyltransferase